MLLQDTHIAKFHDGTVQSDYSASFTFADTFAVLQQSVSCYYIAQTLKGITNTFHVNAKDLFFTSLVATIHGFQHNKMPPCNEEICLQNILDAWQFTRIPVPGDGNCLFTAVAMGIIQQVQNGDMFLSHQMQMLVSQQSLKHCADAWLMSGIVPSFCYNRHFHHLGRFFGIWCF